MNSRKANREAAALQANNRRRITDAIKRLKWFAGATVLEAKMMWTIGDSPERNAASTLHKLFGDRVSIISDLERLQDSVKRSIVELELGRRPYTSGLLNMNTVMDIEREAARYDLRLEEFSTLCEKRSYLCPELTSWLDADGCRRAIKFAAEALASTLVVEERATADELESLAETAATMIRKAVQ